MIGFDPEETTTICLKEDEGKPEAQRIGFVCRFLTCLETRRYERLLSQYDAAVKSLTPKPEVYLFRAILMAVMSVTNAAPRTEGDEDRTVVAEDMLPPFRPTGPGVMPPQDLIDAIEANLSFPKLWKLGRQIPNAIILGEIDKKKLPSKSLLNSGNSATDAKENANLTPNAPPAAVAIPPAV